MSEEVPVIRTRKETGSSETPRIVHFTSSAGEMFVMEDAKESLQPKKSSKKPSNKQSKDKRD